MWFERSKQFTRDPFTSSERLEGLRAGHTRYKSGVDNDNMTCASALLANLDQLGIPWLQVASMMLVLFHLVVSEDAAPIVETDLGRL